MSRKPLNKRLKGRGFAEDVRADWTREIGSDFPADWLLLKLKQFNHGQLCEALRIAKRKVPQDSNPDSFGKYAYAVLLKKLK